MSYHKSNQEKFVLSGKTLDDETIKSITTFFRLSINRKSSTVHSNAKRRVISASVSFVKLQRSFADVSARPPKAGTASAPDAILLFAMIDTVMLSNKEIRAIVVIHDNDCIGDNRRPSYGASKHYHSKHPACNGYRPRDNQPRKQKSSAGHEKGGKGKGTLCKMYSYLGRLAKLEWAKCSENPAIQKKL